PSETARQLGATLASQGASNVAPCGSCHGPNGEGNAQAGFPRLAGQTYVYLLHELNSYFDESRTNPAMSGLAKAMSQAEREAGAAYYASLANAPIAAASAAATGANSRARQLATAGDETRAVQACANCHGPDGIGEGALYPYLAGQHASYLTATLTAWRDGTRHNDPSGQMPIIARALAESDLKAVANYFAQLPPPPRRDDELHARPPASATGASAVVSGPHGGAGAQAAQGVGTAHGALTGGGQGPGGGGAGTGGGPGGSATGDSALPSAPASAASR
ncbi:MAG TPA: c-type cytochrome, partial [Caldimonas sp.]